MTDSVGYPPDLVRRVEISAWAVAVLLSAVSLANLLLNFLPADWTVIGVLLAAGALGAIYQSRRLRVEEVRAKAAARARRSL